jgi:oligopeptide/dipeptide ABC transporter ATP-binding protein
MDEKNNNILLKVKDLSTHFYTAEGTAKAVQEVDFEIKKGRTFALVGESGCGKSVTAMSIMGLISDPPGKIVSGEIIFDGQDLLALSPNRMRSIRGNKIAMIFQEPMTSLNPVFTVGNQIMEAIRLHQHTDSATAREQAIESLSKVGIADPSERIKEYPHQLSGGMRQRVMIAMAMSCRPALLIADEPTTALDVTIQAQILDLMDQLQKENDMSIMLITHDLGVVAERSDYVAVMYASRIVELAAAKKLFDEPLHPYTRGLLRSIPRMDFSGQRLETIPGSVPDPVNFPSGCKFHPRCPIGRDDPKCRCEEPPLTEITPGRKAACWYAGKGK